jgi:sulfur-carrier protein
MSSPQINATLTVQVRFFASLRERLGAEDRRIAVAAGATVADVWRQALDDIPMPPNTLAALNQDYADTGAVVNDGDEVAFFPPVTGG